MPTVFLYHCPTKRLMVQGFLEQERPDDERQQVAVSCLACGQIHFVQPWVEAPPRLERD
jgi:RNase P subunit RPR2